MRGTMTGRILSEHLVSGKLEAKDGFTAGLDLSPREREVVLAGGVLNQLGEEEEER